MKGPEEFSDFGAFFRAQIMPELVRQIEPALNHLRRTDKQTWLKIAMELRRRGGYDRIEQMREQADMFQGLIDTIAEGLKTSIPEFVRQHTLALEQHFYRHGQELDDLLRKSPDTEPMSARESVDAQLGAMGIKFNPNDNR